MADPAQRRPRTSFSTWRNGTCPRSLSPLWGPLMTRAQTWTGDDLPTRPAHGVLLSNHISDADAFFVMLALLRWYGARCGPGGPPRSNAAAAARFFVKDALKWTFPVGVLLWEQVGLALPALDTRVYVTGFCLSQAQPDRGRRAHSRRARAGRRRRAVVCRALSGFVHVAPASLILCRGKLYHPEPQAPTCGLKAVRQGQWCGGNIGPYKRRPRAGLPELHNLITPRTKGVEMILGPDSPLRSRLGTRAHWPADYTLGSSARGGGGHHNGAYWPVRSAAR